MAVQKPKKNIRIAAAQMVFADTINGNLEIIRRWAAQAKRRRADAVLFPECASTSYTYSYGSLTPADVRHAIAGCSEAARKNNINLLVGTPLIRRRKLYNALVVFDRTGKPIHAYAKCQLTPCDAKIFTPGNALSLFEIDGVTATAVICHERRYPELVRIPVMAGAQILFHPNAGLDALKVSKAKRGGRDGVVARAFENAIHYVFANSVGPQGGGKWSAGDSKIVAPDGRVLGLADNENPGVVAATLDLRQASRTYARRSMNNPKYLRAYWRDIVRETRKRSAEQSRQLIESFS
ncbi:MAG: carbon-nitrogen hydrolase family protein [Planctomycetota bacterium]|jgi:predicted amidohydrolase